MFELNNFSAIKLGLASPEKIRSWSRGEVTKPETINYRTQKPEKDGLFCERIFGPTKDWECHCGKYKRIRYKGVVCDKCGVEVTRKKVRRERMGHIELACPVSHIWFFRGIPSKIGVMLDLTIKTLEAVLYYSSYIVLDPKNTDLSYKQVLSDKEFYEAEEKFGMNAFRAGMGATAVKELLSNINLADETATLRDEVKNAKGQKKLKAANRLATVEAFFKSGNKPEWMIMDVLPVIPPDLRPIVQLDGGKIATSDLNDLYRRVINRNNRLKKLLEIGAPDIIVRNEKRMLQEAVDSLIDNGKRGVAVKGAKHELRSLTSILKGKQGRFRANMLGKRVDYSARSVITAGPELKMYQCGLSKHIALELFKPFILKRLVEMNESSNIKAAKKLIERERPIVWDVLEEVIKDHPVLLNRAPTLHRLGIQAFEPVLIEGNAIRLHPLVCTGFNADFDGDQMAVHVPLSLEAQTEARVLMLSTNNILKPSDGNPVCIPSQDMVMGAYYLTMYREGKDAREFDIKGEGMIFASEDEALYAWDQKMVRLQARIKIRKTAELNGKKISGLVETSVGRIIWNRAIPQSIGYVDRTKESEILKYEVDFVVGKKELGDIVLRAFNTQNNTICVKMLDEIKTLGFKFATLASNSISVFDMEIPEIREKVLAEAEARVVENDKQYRRGLITQGERRNLNQQIWDEVFNTLKKEVSEKWSKFNPLKIMADSKARANAEQLAQLAGFVGQVSTASGKRLDVPVKSNYRLGLSNLEFFIKSRGGRKGFADTALKTSSSGYLTRRLVYAAQNIVVTEDDCFDRLGEKIKGVVVKDIVKDGQVVDGLEQRIYGRVAVDDIKAPGGDILVKANQMIDLKTAKAIVAAGIKEVKIRSVLTCRSKQGCCAKCYGKNMSSESIVPIGEAVGVIAAQAIGEPGTQLTMRTFHTGGIANVSDITQGLPRVEELFEARRPKGMAVISEASGKVTLRKADKRDEVIVKTADDAVSYLIPFGKKLTVKNGDIIDAGTPLTEGSLYPQDILKTRGIAGVQEYLLSEILAAYASNSVAVNDKHIEILIRQMLRKVKVENSGDTNLIPGDMVDIFDYEAETEEAIQSGKQPATARRVVLGITKSVKNIESFLAAAGFQETSNALINAAIRGRVDKLTGISENVIIGKKIPAGTGLRRYNKLALIEKTGTQD